MMKSVKYLLFLIVCSLYFVTLCSAQSIPRMDLVGSISDIKSKGVEKMIYVKYSSDDINFESYAKIKIQGASSIQYEKKNYNITFYENEKCEEKRKIDIKWGGMHKYTLKANWIDKSQSRNNVTANIYSDIQKKYNLFNDSINNGVVDGFPIEVYLNGSFYGIYTLNLHKDNFFEEEDIIVVAGKSDSMVTNFKTEAKDDWYSFQVEVGEENEENLNKLNRLIRFVKNSSDEEFVKHFDEYLDLDAMLNYYCYMMFAELVDNGTNNLFLVTYDGNIWYPSMYDLDISWGTSRIGTLIPYEENMNFLRKGSSLWEKFERNYGDYIAVRYFELREDILTKDNVMKEFKKFYKLIPEESFVKENNKWQNIPGYGLEQIEEFLDVRIPFIDREIEKLKTDDYDKIYDAFYYSNRFKDDISNFSYKDFKYSVSMFLNIIMLLIILFFSCSFSKKYYYD